VLVKKRKASFSTLDHPNNINENKEQILTAGSSLHDEDIKIRGGKYEPKMPSKYQSNYNKTSK
jgi:hypothetical protein